MADPKQDARTATPVPMPAPACGAEHAAGNGTTVACVLERGHGGRFHTDRNGFQWPSHGGTSLWRPWGRRR
jgi:hypothetical protein